MTDKVVLDGYQGDLIPEGSQTAPDHILPYTVESDKHIIIDKNQYIVSEPGSCRLSFESAADSEIYLYIKGLNLGEYSDEYRLYFGNDDKYDPNHIYNPIDFKYLSVDEKINILKNHFLYFDGNREVKIGLHFQCDDLKKSIKHLLPYNNVYAGIHDYVINLGYHEEPVTSVEIKFNDPGIYTIDNMTLYCRPMSEYPQEIAALKRNVLENESIGEDLVSGSINLNEPKILYLSIPYSHGWSAKDNGVPVKIYRANDMYMALALDKGSHSIELEYKTPYFREGLLLSIIGVLLFIMFLFIEQILKTNMGNLKNE